MALGGGGDGLWFGASLRPWQILHSRLAGMHTCALVERDVWELMDETVQAASPPSENRKEELRTLAGDEGELWRHGGLMEARIRDWLISKIEDQMHEAPTITSHAYCTSATFSEARDNRMDEQVGEYGDGDQYFDDYGYGDADTIAATYSSELSDNWGGYTYLEEAVYQAVAGALHSGVYEEVDQEEEQQQQQSYNGDNMASAAIWAAPQDTEVAYDLFREDVKASENEEDEPICAVCLEKIFMNEELQGYCINSITWLPCGHSFHSSCLMPWRSASTVCPCCRAPMVPSWPLNLEAPANVGVATSGAANCRDGVEVGMMGLLEEMEAALDRFGLLS